MLGNVLGGGFMGEMLGTALGGALDRQASGTLVPRAPKSSHTLP